VVGYSDTVRPQPGGSSKPHAFLYRNGTVHDLGTLGGNASFATAINSNGTVVGYSTLTPSEVLDHAFVYVDGKMSDLNNVVQRGTGWILRQALAISSLGQITGWGYVGDKARGFILTPV
jgi:probable HAF family extracellular repeat protein